MMRKQIFAALLVLMLLLGGCADKIAAPTGKNELGTETEKVDNAESTSSLLSSESKLPEAPIQTKAPDSTASTETAASQQQKADSQPETPKLTTPPQKVPVSEGKTAVSEPDATEKPQETPIPTENPQETPKPSEPPQQTPEPSEKPSEAPTPTEPPAQSFDVGSYVDYAKSYGQSIGLSLDSTATACWDNPTLASAKSLYIESNLSDLLDWYQASGFTSFWVWSEDLGDGSYNLYVGYA